ncbi:MAG TPA: TonB-dependent receptor [Sphingobium sp.]|nr:TonB-dependent receptor [Sphingobium sp.]
MKFDHLGHGRWTCVKLREGASVIALALAVSCGGIGQAVAQTAGAATAEAARGDDAEIAAGDGAIVITGSRIVRDGMSAPTPVTVVATDYLRDTAPTTLAEGVAQLPQFANSSVPQSTGIGWTGAAGASYLNLRSLDPKRSLVLMDGRRVVPTTSSGSTDINLLPESLVQRVEIVTGGASAAYGSDAVAGVINFVLDTSYTGVKGQLQSGITSRGDNGNYKGQLSFGAPLGSRAHFIGALDYYKSNGIRDRSGRDWALQGWGPIDNPDPNGPRQIIVRDVKSSVLTYGGLITGGPLQGMEFGPGGELIPFDYGTLQSAVAHVGGSGVDVGTSFSVVPALERGNAFGHLRYEVTDDINIFAEALYGRSKANWHSTAAGQYSQWAMTIYDDNAFLPENVRQMMADKNITSFPLGRMANHDIGFTEQLSDSQTLRLTTGFDARFGDWRVDGYYQYGRNEQYIEIYNNPILNNFYRAVDAVRSPVTGDIICRSTLTHANDGCVPFNPFGVGAPSAQAIDYVVGAAWQNQVIRQDVAEVSVSGTPFSLWAGPVSIAFGGGYRKESVDQDADAQSQMARTAIGQGYLGFPTAYEGGRGVFERGNPVIIAGGYDLWEVFGETLIPIARDLPGIRSLELSGAARFTKYSSSRGVTTWKAGLNWEPYQDLRLRVTRSRDIRAANLVERFSEGGGAGQIRDPLFPSEGTRVIVARTGGNPELEPERADTLTVGAVYQPGFIPGLSISADYYDIDIKGAIATLGAQNIVDQCFAGATALCEQIRRDSSGRVSEVLNVFLNVGSFVSKGVDLEASYNRRFANDSSINLRLLASYVEELSTQLPGAARVDRAGQTGVPGGVPHWQGSFSARYAKGPFSALLRERFIEAGRYDNTLDATRIDFQRVKSAFYTDLTLRYDVEVKRGSVEFYTTINNLFDKSPPLAPTFFVFGTQTTNQSLFDTIGRSFTVGARFNF